MLLQVPLLMLMLMPLLTLMLVLVLVQVQAGCLGDGLRCCCALNCDQ